MKRNTWLGFIILAVMVFSLLPAGTTQADSTQPVYILEIDGVINAFSARYLERGLRLAEQNDAQLVIITLDTPGGLETAMREMTQMLLTSPVPTVVFVTPEGARATSAGLFILVAADIAAMSPATNVGAASPVALGAEMDEVMAEKVTSDAAALIRGIASARDRNVEWAEEAVRNSVSLTSEEALEINVIDLIAKDVEDLINQLDGREVAGQTLATRGVLPETEPMSIIERFFHVITEPNIAYLLLSLGTLFVLAELADPGLSIAGIGAVLSFIIAFMALGSLPVNWAAIALLAVSVVFFVVALLTDTEVIVTIAGLVPFVLGSLLLFSPFTPTSAAIPVVRVSIWLIVLMAGLIVFFSLVVLRAVLKAFRQPPLTGAEKWINQTGVALTDLTPDGQVRVGLEKWSAVSRRGFITAGQEIVVSGVSGVRLQVVPAEVTPTVSDAVNERIVNGHSQNGE